MEKKYFADIVITKERLSTGEAIFVAHCTSLGIASQGKTTEEAMENVREAITLYLEEQGDKYEDLELAEEPPFFSIMEITKNAKTASAIR